MYHTTNRHSQTAIIVCCLYTPQTGKQRLQFYLQQKNVFNRFYPVSNKTMFFVPVYKCLIRFTIFSSMPYILTYPLHTNFIGVSNPKILQLIL